MTTKNNNKIRIKLKKKYKGHGSINVKNYMEMINNRKNIRKQGPINVKRL